MAKKDLQKTWEERINRAKAKKKEWEDLMRVKMGRDFFSGKQNPGYPENEWITINKIYSHLMAQLPSLYSVDPYFYVKTKKSFNPDPQLIPQFDAKARIRQSALNYYKGELKLKQKARLCIQDAHFAFGVAKVHYSAEELENPDAGKVSVDEEGKELQDETGPVYEPDTIPVNEKYVISRVHFDDFLFDEDAGSLDDKWCFLAERIRLTKYEAQKKFSKKLLKKLKASEEPDKVKTTSASGDTKTKDQEVYILWEIYDLKNNQWLTLCEGSNELFKEPEKLPPGVEDHPYALLRFTLQDNSPYPIPPVSQAIDPQKEFCLARSQVLTHRKRFNRKYEVVTSKLTDEDQIAKLEVGEDGTCIKVQQNGAVTPIQDAPLDQQRYLEINALSNDLAEIFGSSGESRGIAESDSATQADIIDTRMEIKEGDKLSLVTDFLVDIGRKLDQLIQAHITQDQAVRIVGPEGEFWQVVRSEDYEAIDGEFEYSIDVGATAPRLPQIERAQWTAFMSQVVIPMPHILTAPSFMKKMAAMYGIEDQASLEELRQIGLKIMSGQAPMPGGGGSQQQPGAENPVAAVLGQAMGSLGGNANGGGAPGGMMNA
jgi:hypothetical protein